MSREASSDVSSIGTLDDQQMNNPAPEEEKFQTLQKNNKEILAANEDVQLHVQLSNKALCAGKG